MTDIVDRLRDCENYEDQWQLRQEAADEIEGLRNALGNAGLVIEKLSRDLFACQKDAERYRWLRTKMDGRDVAVFKMRDCPDAELDEEVDAAIDAAMKGEK